MLQYSPRLQKILKVMTTLNRALNAQQLKSKQAILLAMQHNSRTLECQSQSKKIQHQLK